MTQKKEKNSIKSRPPVVVIMGHVDHGKTTLLDYIRKTKVTEGEAGGITQHIGAYQVDQKGKKITFVDTPGHEAFGKMRSRGAKVADIAVLVVAAEEGVKPQTLESIKYIQEAKIPFIVALNKTDKPEANLEKVKKELGEHDVLIEEWGGKVPLVSISAKTGNGVPELLEMILLVAELEELKSEENELFEAVTIESFMDKERGATATLIVKRGTLKGGDKIVCGKVKGNAKIVEDFRGNTINEAGPSMPIRVIGLDGLPDVGEKCTEDEGEKVRISDEKLLEPMMIIGNPESAKALHLVLKADTHGSLEAILNSLEASKSEEVAIEVLKSEIGEVNEIDVKIARSSGAIITSFNLKTDNQIKDFANRNGVEIISSNVIYELIDKIKKEMSLMIEVEIVRKNIGQLQVLAVFRTERQRMIVGGKITEGFLKNRAEIEVVRGEEVIAKGKILQLKKDKQVIEMVEKPSECGLLFEGDPVIKEGDILKAYIEERVKKSL